MFFLSSVRQNLEAVWRSQGEMRAMRLHRTGGGDGRKGGDEVERKGGGWRRGEEEKWIVRVT